MEAETIIVVLSTLGGLAAAVKVIAEARKAKFERKKAQIEVARAQKAEKTTNAIIYGVEKAKRTVHKDLAQYLSDEIRGVAELEGVEPDLNKMVKDIKSTKFLSRDKLKEKLDRG